MENFPKNDIRRHMGSRETESRCWIKIVELGS